MSDVTRTVQGMTETLEISIEQVNNAAQGYKRNLGRVSPLWKGEWTPESNCTEMDIYRHLGAAWVCLKDCTGIEPGTNDYYWAPAVYDGQEGPQGPAGEVAAQGAEGAQGTQGSAGQDGSQGAQGTIGETGSQGADGTQGTQGSIGETGAQGADGKDGSQGADGTQGNRVLRSGVRVHVRA